MINKYIEYIKENSNTDLEKLIGFCRKILNGYSNEKYSIVYKEEKYNVYLKKFSLYFYSSISTSDSSSDSPSESFVSFVLYDSFTS